MKKLFTFTACAVLFVSIFCGFDSQAQGKSGTAGSKVIEPAMIISRADARALTGVSFGECTVKEQPAVGLKLCVYEQDGAFLQLGLTQAAFMKRKGNSPESIYNSIKSAFKDAPRIEGVGDDNFIAPPGLHIMKGGYYLTISLGLMNKDREKLKAAGMKAVENLSSIK